MPPKCQPPPATSDRHPPAQCHHRSLLRCHSWLYRRSMSAVSAVPEPPKSSGIVSVAGLLFSNTFLSLGVNSATSVEADGPM
ncbi:uncharacterized protein SCHCODRAFT_02621010 [Schizophyllum commune H4-8]|uniref:uncharacterized protein n=1 Tax=Schizophyllum commune (strain H4-8 / FGSC 9210) TaxID=578458 RepID=UPI0021602E84|nr:uncharacterized protein SCHCODRAFT_02621010 [Schizophyllum commune H4-8]KAI5893156.1 hypothetical protein SCHCODRAFT_02621010 [Schizophyllum commune H4-8]